MSHTVAGLILAAGKGTRMKSALPKTLHAVCGVPMVDLVGRAMLQAGIEESIVVIGHEGEQIQKELGSKYRYAWQREQLGTGHAVMSARDLIECHKGPIVVAAGDTPLLSAEIIAELIEIHLAEKAACTVATVELENPTGYGRIVREGGHRSVDAVPAAESGGHRSVDAAPTAKFVKIVEQKEATKAEDAIKEINAALYVFDNAELQAILPTLSNTNKQGEYYLTDALEALAKQGKTVIAHKFKDETPFRGVNDRWQLAEADKALRLRVLKQHALNGVTLIDPESTYIGVDVQIGPDTIIEPQTYITGETTIGADCHIGPSTRIKSSQIADGCFVYFSQLDQATLHPGVKVGPFAHLRPGTILSRNVKIGNFVEVKNATLGEGSAANHLSYIGDASVGVKTNIGAGTITCNYDGFGKHRTTIGDGVFVGSNSTLVAPVTLMNGVIVAAGSVITNDVPEDAGAFGRARQETKEGWALHWRQKRKQQL